MNECDVCVALAGNPNAGKSTIFNALTGAHQHVGNWPGKTVARKAGWFLHNGYHIEVVDLPGTYSLSAYSPEEQITRDFLVKGHPDLVVHVLDATNIERNLYLCAQILETGAAMVVVLNLIDVAEARGLKIDISRLSELLGGIFVIPMVASRRQGLDELKQAIFAFATHTTRKEPCYDNSKSPAFSTSYPDRIQPGD
ncbi:MAG: GTP-binding protein [Chloroflexaceae bacterium]|nr:GTP-binding protein [Chloroflexaceae bacterium]